jgi:3-dehydroquinate synthase
MEFYTKLNEGIIPPEVVFHDARFTSEDIVANYPAWTEVNHWVPLEGGEGLKSWMGMEHIWAAMERVGVGRGQTVAAVGGGTVTDAVGFAASTWKRGVPTVLMPTTLVGMVDAAHGGKTALNFHGYKNILGTHHPPQAVIVIPEWLESLPEHELRSGWFELVKHALISSPQAWDRVAAVHTPTLHAILPLIADSCDIKRAIVEKDPFESGLRKVLNFGHTVGHALEAWSHAKGTPIPHGICVGHGMRWVLQWGSPELALEIDPHLKRWLSAETPSAAAAEVWPWMVQDKKNSGREVREVVLDAVGAPRWDVPLTESEFLEAWEHGVEA